MAYTHFTAGRLGTDGGAVRAHVAMHGELTTEAIARGEERYRAGAFGDALRIFAGLAEEMPGDPAVLRLLGLCRVRTGDVSGGLHCLGEAHRLAPDDPYARLHYGIGLHASGRHAEAAERFEECLNLLPMEAAPALNLAAARLMVNDSRGALEAAQRAVVLAPEMPQALYTLGLAQLANDLPQRAAESFGGALKAAPGFADAWVSFGLAHYAMGDPALAEQAMRKALETVPDHPVAIANLAVFLRLRGAIDQAQEMLTALLSRNPDAVEARLNVASWKLQEEKADEALALLSIPAPSDVRARQHWDEQRVLALIQVGRLQDARSLMGSMVAPASGATLTLLWRQALLHVAEGNQQAATAIATQMDERLDLPNEVLEHRIMAHFNLAKFWSSSSSDRAFPYWQHGHALLRRIQPFSREVERDFTDACIRYFDRARMNSGPRAGNSDRTPIFVVGMPRSGTTLVEQILSSHQLIHGAGERAALGHVFATLGGAVDSAGVKRIITLDEATLDVEAERYLAALKALAPGAAGIVDKMPGNYRLLGLVSLMLPGARIIHCRRDPRDVGLSIFTYRFFGYHPYAHDLGDLGWYIAEHDRLMSHWYDALPNQVLPIELDAWVNDFDATLRGLLTFVDVPYDPECARFYAVERDVKTVSRAQVREPVNGRGIGRWRNYESHLAPMIAALREGGVPLPD